MWTRLMWKDATWTGLTWKRCHLDCTNVDGVGRRQG
jgi:hypothetical protein